MTWSQFNNCWMYMWLMCMYILCVTEYIHGNGFNAESATEEDAGGVFAACCGRLLRLVVPPPTATTAFTGRGWGFQHLHQQQPTTFTIRGRDSCTSISNWQQIHQATAVTGRASSADFMICTTYCRTQPQFASWINTLTLEIPGLDTVVVPEMVELGLFRTMFMLLFSWLRFLYDCYGMCAIESLAV